MQIIKGPFRGIDIPDHEITVIGDDLVPFWGTSYRTPLFLERFPPTDGWQVILDYCPGPIDLPDIRDASIPRSDVLVQPTQLFIAKLLRNGCIINQASVLAIIDGPSAWERGETTARGRLYEAMGLPGILKITGHETNVGNQLSGFARPVPGLPLVLPIAAAAEPDSNATTVSTVAITAAEPKGPEVAPPDQSQKADTVISSSPMETVATLPEANSRPFTATSTIASSVNSNFRDQIVILASTRKIACPTIANNAEAKAWLKDNLAPAPAGA